MPEISRHSVREYYSFAKLFRLKLVSLFDNIELLFPYNIFRSASSLVNLALSSSKLFTKSFRIEVTGFYSSIINVPILLYSVSLKMIWYDPYSCLNLIKTCSNFNYWITKVTTTFVGSLNCWWQKIYNDVLSMANKYMHTNIIQKSEKSRFVVEVD